MTFFQRMKNGYQRFPLLFTFAVFLIGLVIYTMGGAIVTVLADLHSPAAQVVDTAVLIVYLTLSMILLFIATIKSIAIQKKKKRPLPVFLLILLAIMLALWAFSCCLFLIMFRELLSGQPV